MYLLIISMKILTGAVIFLCIREIERMIKEKKGGDSE